MNRLHARLAGAGARAAPRGARRARRCSSRCCCRGTPSRTRSSERNARRGQSGQPQRLPGLLVRRGRCAARQRRRARDAVRARRGARLPAARRRRRDRDDRRRLGGAADLLPAARQARPQGTQASPPRSASSGASSSPCCSPRPARYAGWRMRAGRARPAAACAPAPSRPAHGAPSAIPTAEDDDRALRDDERSPAAGTAPADARDRAAHGRRPRAARARRRARRPRRRAPRRPRRRAPPARAPALSAGPVGADVLRGPTAGRGGARAPARRRRTDAAGRAGAYHCADDAAPPRPSGARARQGRRRRPPWRTSPTGCARRLPAGRVHRAGLLPGDQARQAGARRGSGRRRQDRAGQGARRATSAASSCACSATRASTRPRRCTSGTTASSCCASRPRPTGTGWDAVQDDIFGEEFLLARPLMKAIASEQPVVLLIDEIDKTDQEFEAMLLEVLSRLPDLDPRARAASSRARTRSCCSPRTTRAS